MLLIEKLSTLLKEHLGRCAQCHASNKFTDSILQCQGSETLIANLSYKRKQTKKGKAFLSYNQKVYRYDVDKRAVDHDLFRSGKCEHMIQVPIIGRKRLQH